MSGSTQQPITTSTQTSSPWSGAQPYLSQMFANAQQMQQGGVGYQPYTGPTVAPLIPQMTDPGQGLTSLTNFANVAASGAEGTYGRHMQEAMDVANYIGGAQGITPGVGAALQGLGTAAGQYGNIYQQAQGNENPYLLASIADANQRGNAAIQSSMSAAGRYGSGQYQDVMARAQAQVADPLLMQDYEARQNRALQATQGLGQTYGQQAGIYQQGLGQAMQAYGMLPSLFQGQLLPAQTQLATAQYLQDRAQQELQGQIAQYNAQQAYPWQQLQRESAIIGGAGNLGGTTVTTQTPIQPALTQRLLGGALVGGGLGSTIGGPIGAAGGAGLGALAGAFL